MLKTREIHRIYRSWEGCQQIGTCDGCIIRAITLSSAAKSACRRGFKSLVHPNKISRRRRVHSFGYILQSGMQLQQYQNQINNQITERNQKIAAILTLVITFNQKIEAVKEKICGYSVEEFSPEQFYEALDTGGKGYIGCADICAFLANDRIADRHILLLFHRLNGLNQQISDRLTYIGYLSLLRPHFRQQLARDLLLRDSLARQFVRSSGTPRLEQSQQALLLLLNQLILLSCVCVAQHEELKASLAEEYMLNVGELSQILGIRESSTPIKAIHEFIHCNSQYEVNPSQVRYLLSYLRIHQYGLSQERALRTLFMPNPDPKRKMQRQSIQEESKKFIELKSHHQKQFLTRGDLLASHNRTSFLDYIHPRSYQNREENNHLQPHRDTEPVPVAEQHQPIDLHQMRRSVKDLKKQKIFQEQLQQSIVAPHKISDKRHDESARDIRSCRQVREIRLRHMDREIDTPILQQFMHDSNIRLNMGRNAAQKRNQLTSLLQSRENSQDAFQVVEYSYGTGRGSRQKQERPRQIKQEAFRQPVNQQYNKMAEKYQPGQEESLSQRAIEKSYIASQLANQSSLARDRSQVGSAVGVSGILGQFLRSGR